MEAVLATIRRQLTRGLVWLQHATQQQGPREEIDAQRVLGKRQRQKARSSAPLPVTPSYAEALQDATRSQRDILHLLESDKPQLRSQRARAIPELNNRLPQQPLLAFELLRHYYVEGQPARSFADEIYTAASVTRRAKRYLQELAYWRVNPVIPPPALTEAVDPAWREFKLARSTDERRYALYRHPELLAWLTKLEPQEARVFELFYELPAARTSARVAALLDLPQGHVLTLKSSALRKLAWYDAALSKFALPAGLEQPEVPAERPRTEGLEPKLPPPPPPPEDLPLLATTKVTELRKRAALEPNLPGYLERLLRIYPCVKERDVDTYRLIVIEGQTQAVTAEQFGISTTRIRHIIAKVQRYMSQDARSQNEAGA